MKSRQNTILFSLIAFFSLFSLYSLNTLNNNSEQLQTLRDNRFMMISKAGELRQSSDDLSRHARTYVVRAEEKYKNHYYDTLDIRDGVLERPYYYEGIYWDLLEPIRSQRHRANTKENLDEVLQDLPFMENELKLLAKAKALSDILVSLEERAFYLMDGLYQDDEGEYTEEGDVNQKAAIELLFSSQYHVEKSKTMLPIDDFLFLFTKRTSLEIHVLKKTLSQNYLTLLFSLLGLIISVITFAILSKNIRAD